MDNICKVAGSKGPKTILAVILFWWGVTSFAQERVTDEHIVKYRKDHYFVQLKKPEAERDIVIVQPDPKLRGIAQVPFGLHSTDQNYAEIEAAFEIEGEVLQIFETLNSFYVRMPAEEADRLARDPRVDYVERDILIEAQGTQTSPGWALDRIDDVLPTQPLDGTYTYTSDGSGRTIYILDSGLDVGSSYITAEFGTRASLIWDANGGTGDDCLGHGTSVASVAASNTYGVAKGATVIAAKITIECTRSSYISSSVTAFNWLAQNAPQGTIVNWSHSLSNSPLCTPFFNLQLEAAMISAHNAGIFIFVSAGNDGCDTAAFSPTRLGDDEVYVVGGTSNLPWNITPPVEVDALWVDSRIGTEISVFAPAYEVPSMDHNGNFKLATGTSFAAPIVAGTAAVACSANPYYCNTYPIDTIYNDFRSLATTGTLMDPFLDPIPTGTPNRFIRQMW